MNQIPITKEQIHKLNQDRFRKTPQEKLELKAAKSAWKLSNPKK